MTPTPERRIGLGLATGLVAGNIIGSGVFLLPATLGAIGSVSVFGWIFGTLAAFATTAVFAQLGRIASTPEGLVGYAGAGLGRLAGFAIAVFYWMGAWVGTVAMAVAIAGYFAVFVPALAAPIPLALTAVAALWILTGVNILGARAATRLSSLTLVAGLLPILSVAIAGWAVFDPKVFAASWNVSGQSDFGAVKTSMISVFWAFTGFESAAVATAVVRDPERNVARATYAGTALAAVVYIAASTALMGMAPARELAASTAPFALAVGKVLGPAAALVVAACALAKTCGTCCGWILVSAESARAGANVHLFPGRFAAHGGRLPVRILLVMAAVMSAAVLATVSPSLGKQFGVLINVSTVWVIIPYAVCCVALWRLAGRLSPAARLASRVAAVLALAFNGLLLATSDAPTVWLTAALALAIAILWFAVARRAGKAVLTVASG
ncbi:amino acid permease [Caulobacter sp. KR2-114]|uniref:amino acid permease n=1 Tax=Caulobacter sp. KR2-114 TaxID=3400912 RepID=UPI003C1170C5